MRGFTETLRSAEVLLPGQNLSLHTDDPLVAGEYKSIIHDVMPERGMLKIAMPTFKGKVVPLPRGTRVFVRVFDKSAMYIFNSVVLGYNKDEEGFYVTYIRLPDTLKRVQRRSYVRVPMVVEGRFYVGEDVYNFVTKDFSAGGAQIVLERFLPLGTVGEIEFDLADYEIPRMPAKIVREAGKTSDGRYIYGVQFLDVDNKLERKLIQLVYDYERKLRRR
ncbi:MAG: PilZ domain-containing protein [Thermotogae bacterium]|nr:PilZ domain-containing protein [Thermotogota bacterium]